MTMTGNRVRTVARSGTLATPSTVTAATSAHTATTGCWDQVTTTETTARARSFHPAPRRWTQDVPGTYSPSGPDQRGRRVRRRLDGEGAADDPGTPLAEIPPEPSDERLDEPLEVAPGVPVTARPAPESAGP